MSYAVGSLVKARGREWVVLPESDGEWLVVRPLGGTDQETTGLFLPLEQADITPATFAYPDPTQLGDFVSCQLLRDAVRLGFRSSAGPFRSFARINVEPRPYQLVPLLMALKLDPIRLLIADDVGIGKTVEAGLIARELLDRGEIQRMAVLCPPHLAEQWQAELAEKFHIEAQLVLSSTVSRLERNTTMGQSLFDLHPFVIVSTEYIKSPRRRDEFVRTCPELVIVDEAHTCAFDSTKRSSRHLRHQLLKRLSEDNGRHLILVTATPHSGNEGAFRSLLGLLREDFLQLPQDLSGRANQKIRQEVAQHLVQRRRADVRAFMDANTVFPEREEAEDTYILTDAYKKLFADILQYARQRIVDESGTQHRRRVRWWSALALLRSLASSPAAASATLRTRSATIEADTPEEADRLGEQAILDLDDSETGEFLDITPGAQEGEEQPQSERERLLVFARRAEKLQGLKGDAKLKKIVSVVKKLLKDGYAPILFCRFIATADYLAQELRGALPKKVEVTAVTGQLPPAERERRVQQMGEYERRVLVATDCLSEGINLQDNFNAVIHYDLSWNPTRHEQREGRIDRYGQAHPTVRTLTYYGTDNQIDGIVLDVLLRKHRAIRNTLGISVPVPASTGDVVQALMQGVLLRGYKPDAAQQLSLFDTAGEAYKNLHVQWDNVTEREKRSRSLFAQNTIDVSQVAEEWRSVRSAIGTGVDVERFIRTVIPLQGGVITAKNETVRLRLPDNLAIQDAIGGHETLKVQFALPVPENVVYLNRTHPIVEGLATHVMDTALDPYLNSIAKRTGAIRTDAVSRTVTLLLLRFRYHLVRRQGRVETPLLAEACEVVAFTGRPSAPQFLTPEQTEQLLTATPSANIDPQQATAFLQRLLGEMESFQPELNRLAEEKAEALLTAHERVRTATRQRGVRHTIQPQLPPDLLGVYLLLPDK